MNGRMIRRHRKDGRQKGMKQKRKYKTENRKGINVMTGGELTQ